MNVKPNFFIIGAPKCGTSSLASWLSEHPEVYMSQVKEPHFYSTDLNNSSIKDYEQYKSLFFNVKNIHKAIGEASTWYLYSKNAIDNIEKEYLEVKYIVMSRDPVDMCHSLYHHNVRVLHEDQNSFKKAWSLQKERDIGANIPFTCEVPEYLQYYKACSLGSLLKRLYSKVESERILHITLENIKDNPQKEYLRVLKFLKISDDKRDSFPVLNEAGTYRNKYLQILLQKCAKIKKTLGIQKGFGFSKVNRIKKDKDKIPEYLKEELDEIFKEEKELLEKFKC